ncbi:MAG: VWA domain-containing protein [Ahrensia sp.]|nr:VWA domain-containing protein [Ahrensia sp.]
MNRSKSDSSEISAFLSAAKSAGNGAKGRVVFALDATMSRQPTWDMACHIQGDMFISTGKTTPLSMQLVYFRGFDECRASRWARSGEEFANMMARIDCRAGHTQIEKVLKHAHAENTKMPINALVYIGDAMEENPDALGAVAGQLGLRNVPVFMFQEGHDGPTESVFKEVARLTRGGWFRFDRNSPDVLKGLLSSIAVYATGGIKALQLRGAKSDQLLIDQMGRGGTAK